MVPEAFDMLLHALAAIYAGENCETARATATALITTPPPDPIGPQTPCRYDAMIRALAGERTALPAARAVAAAQHLIPWDCNPVADKMTADASAICSVAALMSPEGPIPAPHLRLGLFYQRPDSYYSLHNHDADETYVILAGGALWTAGEDQRWRGAGSMIHHPSLLPHAFRTGPEGMLALWRWSGDVNTHSYAFLPDPDAQAV